MIWSEIVTYHWVLMYRDQEGSGSWKAQSLYQLECENGIISRDANSLFQFLIYTQIAKTIGSTLIAYRSFTFASDGYIIAVDLKFFAIWVVTGAWRVKTGVHLEGPSFSSRTLCFGWRLLNRHSLNCLASSWKYHASTQDKMVKVCDIWATL